MLSGEAAVFRPILGFSSQLSIEGWDTHTHTHKSSRLPIQMHTLISQTRVIALGAALFLAACSSHEGGASGTQSLSSTLQDLSIDPSGRTTVSIFTAAPTG